MDTEPSHIVQVPDMAVTEAECKARVQRENSIWQASECVSVVATLTLSAIPLWWLNAIGAHPAISCGVAVAILCAVRFAWHRSQIFEMRLKILSERNSKLRQDLEETRLALSAERSKYSSLYLEFESILCISVPPHGSVRIQPLVESHGLGFLTQSNASNEPINIFGGPGAHSFCRCKITNDTDRTAFDVEFGIKGQFTEFIPDKSDPTGLKGITNITCNREWTITVDRIDPGVDRAAIVLLQNKARQGLLVTIWYPEVASMKFSPDGVSESKKVAHKSPAHTCLGSSIPETIPAFLWNQGENGASTKRKR